MSERLQELVELFLQRECTPEQEKELFDTCLHDPTAPETLRQQMLLSLKIRQLRDRAEVPHEVRNELLRKINTLSVDESATEKKRFALPVWLQGLRLGWSHVAVAATTAAVALFFLWDSGEMPNQLPTAEQQFTTVSDTVLIHTTDTLREIKKVRVPVYISRDNNIAKDERVEQTDPKQANVPVTDENASIAANTGNPSVEPDEASATIAVRELEVSKSPYMEQYTQIVSTMDKVVLTSDDRVRY